MPIILLLLGAGVYLYYNQAKQFQSSYTITFHDASFDFDKTSASGFTKLYFKIRFEVNNPTGFVGTLQGAKLNIFYNSKLLGYTVITNPITVTPNGITKVELPVSVPTLSLITSVQEIIDAISNRKSITFNLDGQLQFSIGTLTVKTAYKVPLLY